MPLAEITAVTVIAIAIPVVIVLAGVFFAVAAVRGPGAGGQGRLDREAMRRDELRRRRLEEARVAALERARTAAVPVSVTGEAGTGVAAEPEPQPLGGALALREEAEELEPYVPEVVPADPIEVGITRRQVLNRSAVLGSVFGLAAFGGASLAFLIPPPTVGFGGKVPAPDPLDDIKSSIRANGVPYYVAEGRYYVVLYEPKSESQAANVYADTWENVKAAGVQVLFQKCPHLGCKVPFCQSSGWFECPCHGSQYNSAGERQGGPAPRGMDRFPFTAGGGRLVVNTGKRIEGPTVGTNTIDSTPLGPHCV
jgi:cytochrome b6-f complex iron-sulfur subunit